MNAEHTISPGVFYIHYAEHRNNNPQKSQWTINEEQERTCFSRSLTSSWYAVPGTCWGVHFEGERVTYLGVTSRNSVVPSCKLFIAKFVDGNLIHKWHGYPANPIENSQDIPPNNVLQMWLKKRYLRASIIRKLSRGQKCKL